MDFLNGKKTYLTLIAVVALGLIESWNGYCGMPGALAQCTPIVVPGFVYSILGGLGIYARASAKK